MTLIRREYRSMFSDAAVFGALAAGVLVLCAPLMLHAYIAVAIVDDPVEALDSLEALPKALHLLILLAAWGIFPALGASLVQRDLDRGALEELRASPVLPFQLVVAKLVGLLGWACLAAVSLMPVLLFTYIHFAFPWGLLIESSILSGCVAFCASTLGLLVACGVRRPLLVPFALYGLVGAVVAVPVLVFLLLAWLLPRDAHAFSKSDYVLWDVLHPWQIWADPMGAFGYLAYLAVVAVVALALARRMVNRAGDVRIELDEGAEARPWYPIRDFSNPVAGIYSRTNPFSPKSMQRVLFVVGVVAGLAYPICLFEGWGLFTLGHFLNLDFLIFALFAVGILVASQEIASRTDNRDQLRMTFLRPKAVDAGNVWGAVRLCRLLLLGLVVGRFTTYLVYELPFGTLGFPESLLHIVIDTITYVPILLYFVLNTVHTGRSHGGSHLHFTGKVVYCFGCCYVVEMISGMIGQVFPAVLGAPFFRLAAYLIYAGFTYWTVLGQRSDDEPWKTEKSRWRSLSGG